MSAVVATPIVVLDADSDEIDAAGRALLGSQAAHALSARGIPDVMGQADLTVMLDIEARRQQLGCGDASCAAEIAGAMGAERVIASRVTRSQDGLTWHLILVDARAARVLARGEARADTLEALVHGAPHAIAPLADALGAPFRLPAFVTPVALGSIALGLVGAGVATDALSPTSRNAKLDAADMVAPACYVGAAGVAAGAVLFAVLSEAP